MHFDTATRQRWMSVLAHSDPEELLARMQTLQLAPDYELIRAPETGLVQLQARMGGPHRFQGARQVQGGEGFHGADAQFADAFAHLAHGARRLPFQRQHAAGVVEQHAAGGGEFQTTPLAEEELGTQFFFQLADAAGDVGLHGVQLARGGQDAAFLDDGLEGAEGDQFHGFISIKERFVLDKSFVQII